MIRRSARLAAWAAELAVREQQCIDRERYLDAWEARLCAAEAFPVERLRHQLDQLDAAIDALEGE